MNLKDEFEEVPWFLAEPLRRDSEIESMRVVAPELQWHEELPGGYWEGLIPKWPFDRTPPATLDDFLRGERLHVRISCSPAHPAVVPKVFPISPEPDLQYRTMHRWHVSGDGSLCLLQNDAAWTGEELASELAVKAAGWLIEYLLLSRSIVQTMTLGGIVNLEELDHLIVADPG